MIVIASPKKSGDPIKPKRPPAKTPKARENQMISLAVDQAELQLREGVAPAPVVVHYLKLASEQHNLELERLRNENLLLRKKTEQIDQTARIEELYSKAIDSMKMYQGHGAPEEYDVDTD